MLDKQFYDAPNIHLLVVAEVEKPSGELVDSFNLPCHNSSMPYKALCYERHKYRLGSHTHQRKVCRADPVRQSIPLI